MLAYVTADWSATPDWAGYAELYRTGGGWLAGRRDPLFVGFLNLGRLVFGDGGYQAFRFAVALAFAGGAGFLAWRSPPQLVRPSGPAVFLVITAGFALKAFVHIREGLALLLIVFAIWPYLRGPIRPIRSTFLLASAAACHMGAIWIAWPAALATVRKRAWAARPWMAAVSLAAGLGCAGVAWLCVDQVHAVLAWMGSALAGGRAPDAGGLLYWFAQGGVAGFLSFRLWKLADHAATEAGRSILQMIALWVLPFTYALCVGLVFGAYPVAALSTLSIRLLFTTMELALILVLGVGGIGALGLIAAAFMLADRLSLAGLALGRL